MENTELMNNEVMNTEETADIPCEKDNYTPLLVIAGLSAIGGVVAYNYVIKPVAGKVKNFIAKKKAEAEEKKNNVIVMEESEVKVS